MRSMLTDFLSDERGTSMVEYAVLIAIVSSAIIPVIDTFRTELMTLLLGIFERD